MKTGISLVLILAAISALAAPGIYRWVDADGNVHFSDCPPEPEEKCQVEELDIDARPKLADEELQDLSERRVEKREDLHERSQARREEQQQRRREQRETRVQQDEFDQRQCALARENLEQLLRAEPVYREKRNGVVRQTEDEILRDTETMRALIDEHCED